MSKGKLSLPNIKGETNFEDSFIELLKRILSEADVFVNDELWQTADSDLQSKLSELSSRIEALAKDTQPQIAELKCLIDSIKQQLGSDTRSVFEVINSLKKDIVALKANKPTAIVVKTPKGVKKDLGLSHKNLPTLLTILSQHINVYLVGPSGSGKTHAARQCAEALGVDFYFTGAIANEYKLTGYMDANGKYVSTEFRKAYEKGGLFLFDEIDASFPQAVLAFNAALANDFMDFPDQQVKKHKNFYCIAAANTIGQGADRQYVGRNQLDAASLDRFVFLDWPYDENLEIKLSGNKEWTFHVQKARKIIDKYKIRHIVSPRASIFGAQLLEQGISKETVENLVLWKGLPENDKIKIQESMLPPTEIKAKRKGQFLLRRDYRNSVNLSSGNNVSKDQCIGYIKYYDNFSRYYDYIEVLSPCNGVITYSIPFGEEVERGTIIAIIEH